MLLHKTASPCTLCLLRVLCVRFFISTFSELMKESFNFKNMIEGTGVASATFHTSKL